MPRFVRVNDVNETQTHTFSGTRKDLIFLKTEIHYIFGVLKINNIDLGLNLK